MNPIVIISQAVATGGLSGARPVLTLFLIQLFAVFVDSTKMAEGLEWIINPYVIGTLGALSVVEHFIRTDPDFEQMMKIPNQIINTAVAMMSAFLLVQMGYEEQVTLPDPAGATEASLGAAIFTAGASGGLTAASVIAAATTSAALTWLRSYLMDALDALAVPSKWWRWIEAGGVVGLVTVVVLLPFAAVALAVLIILASGLAAGSVWAIQRKREQKRRGPCPQCGYDLRHEATLCPECGHERAPDTLLAPAATTPAA